MYKYPDIYVCLYNYQGCDDVGLEEDCMRSAQGTEGENSTAVFNQGKDNEKVLGVEANATHDVRPPPVPLYVLEGSPVVGNRRPAKR